MCVCVFKFKNSSLLYLNKSAPAPWRCPALIVAVTIKVWQLRAGDRDGMEKRIGKEPPVPVCPIERHFVFSSGGQEI